MVTVAVADSAVVVVAMYAVATVTAAFVCCEDDTVATGAGAATFVYVTVAGAVGIGLWNMVYVVDIFIWLVVL